MDKEVVLSNFRSLEEYLSDSVAQPRFRALAAEAFAAFALALAVVGIYGVVSYSVAQRTHEMGIRVAVGASRWDILRLAIADGLVLVLAGLAVGLAVALATMRLLSGLLFGVTATDPPTLAGTSLFLAGVALLACYLPARRAARIDPVVALRCE